MRSFRIRSGNRRGSESDGKDVTAQNVIPGIRATLQELGVRSLFRQISWMSLWSLIAGFSQASLLVIITQLAVSGVEGKGRVHVAGVRMSTGNALLLCVLILIAYLVASVIAALAMTAMSRRAIEVGRGGLIESFFHASWAVQSQEKLGHVQQLLTVNCENIGNILLSIAGGIQSLLSLLALLAVAFSVNPLAAAAVLIFGLILFVVLRPLNKVSSRVSRQLSAASREMATRVTEYSRLTRELRTFGVQDGAVAELQELNTEAAIKFWKSRNLSQMTPVVYQIMALGFLIAGAALILHEKSDVASTGAVLLLILRSLTYGSSFQQLAISIRGYQAYLEDIRKDLAKYNTSRERRSAGLTPEYFSVTFDAVEFSYDGKTPAIDRVSFSIGAGQMLGVVGRSGSGKTTLTQLLLGMRRSDRGEVLLGDIPIGDLQIGEGRSPIAFVPQEPILLRGSVAYNIAFFRDVPTAAIEAAARAAQLHDEVTAMPEGYGTDVGEGGGALSGGQRQRLAIARALVTSPRLLVLDEPTSALDGRSESLVRSTLANLRGTMTIVVISHRLAAIEDCDVLLVLRGGKVAAFGESKYVRASEAFQRVLGEVLPKDPSEMATDTS